MPGRLTDPVESGTTPRRAGGNGFPTPGGAVAERFGNLTSLPVEAERIETVLAAYRTSMHRPASAADVAAADRWAVELVTLAKALTPTEKAGLERRLGDWKAAALIEFAKRASATTLADRASERLVDAVLAFELAGLTHPDGIERGLTHLYLRIPFHAALTVDGSFQPLWSKVRPWLHPSVREEVAADLDRWQDDPEWIDDFFQITSADDGTYRYEEAD